MVNAIQGRTWLTQPGNLNNSHSNVGLCQCQCHRLIVLNAIVLRLDEDRRQRRSGTSI